MKLASSAKEFREGRVSVGVPTTAGWAGVVRADLALLDQKFDGDLLVNLHVDAERKIPHVRRIRINGKIVATMLETHADPSEANRARLHGLLHIQPIAQTVHRQQMLRLTVAFLGVPTTAGWARDVRADLALFDQKIDGDLLVNLHVENRRKLHRAKEIRIAGNIVAIKLKTHLAGPSEANGPRWNEG
jgi:hypothetical protein